jgi:hypothetical protein
VRCEEKADVSYHDWTQRYLAFLGTDHPEPSLENLNGLIRAHHRVVFENLTSLLTPSQHARRARAISRHRSISRVVGAWPRRRRLLRNHCEVEPLTIEPGLSIPTDNGK